MRTKTLWIKDEYLQQILAGQKTIEVRVAYSNLQRLQAGDLLLLNGQYTYRIHRISQYVSFSELLAHEDPQKIAPGIDPGTLLALIKVLYPPEKEALGVLALEIAPESTYINS